MSRASRGSPSALLVLAGALLTLVGGLVVYVQTELVDRDAFSDRAVDSLHDRAVRDLVAQEVAAQLLGGVGLALGASAPELEATVDRGIRSARFERAFRVAAAEAHDALFSGEEASVFFDVPQVGRALAPTIERVAPGFADSIPLQAETRLLEIERRHPGLRALRLADDMGPLGIGLLLAGLALLAGAFMLAPDRRAALTRIALALGVGSALIAAALLVFRQVAVASAQGGYALADGDVGPAVEGVWNAYAGDLLTLALVCAVVALSVALVSRRWSPTRLR